MKRDRPARSIRGVKLHRGALATDLAYALSVLAVLAFNLYR